ncbi:MAG: hypothetical protein ACYDCK_08930, partial [Thermoplasmatota archaeon]
MRAAVLLVTCVVLASLVPLASVPAQSTSVNIAVKAVTATYGPETWKDEAPAAAGIKQGLAPPGPLGGAGPFAVYENPYADPRSPHQGPMQNWWGYRADVDLALVDAAGKDVPPSAGAYFVEAVLRTVVGDIPAKLTKTGATTFRATFDLDGEDGKDFPPLPTTGGTLRLEAWQAPTAPLGAPQQLGSSRVELDAANVLFDRVAALLPDSIVPGYNDAAPGNFTWVAPNLVDPAKPFNLTFTFAEHNASAVVSLISGANAREIYNGSTGPMGRVPVAFEPGAALGSATNGMLLLEAHL